MRSSNARNYFFSMGVHCTRMEKNSFRLIIFWQALSESLNSFQLWNSAHDICCYNSKLSWIIKNVLEVHWFSERNVPIFRIWNKFLSMGVQCTYMAPLTLIQFSNPWIPKKFMTPYSINWKFMTCNAYYDACLDLKWLHLIHL